MTRGRTLRPPRGSTPEDSGADSFILFEGDTTPLAWSPEIGSMLRSFGNTSVNSLRARFEAMGAGVVVQQLQDDSGAPKTLVAIRKLRRNTFKRNIAAEGEGLQTLIGDSPQIHELREHILRAGRANFPVLITGETGVGKELCARGIHDVSPRAQRPFVAVNCAAIPVNLAEAMLFGYEPGAFTDAMKCGHVGKFELAHTGTLFLDEVSEMPLSLQAKVLRVVQDSEVERLNGSRPIKVDVHLIAATNRDLKGLVRANCFRADLFYRLNVIGIQIPPVRERRDDIPRLIDCYLNKICHELDIAPKLLSSEILQRLYEYSWPGNVRELINIVKQLIISVDESHHTVDRLPPEVGALLSEGALNRSAQASARTSPEDERQRLIESLKQSRGNRSEAARKLGIHRSTLYAMLRRHGMEIG
jgi:transcriptional regulator with PAS, ATPase and Fis domain